MIRFLPFSSVLSPTAMSWRCAALLGLREPLFDLEPAVSVHTISSGVDEGWCDEDQEVLFRFGAGFILDLPADVWRPAQARRFVPEPLDFLLFDQADEHKRLSIEELF